MGNFNIEKKMRVDNDTIIYQIEIQGSYLVNNCKPVPFAHLINDEQAIGIIKDAILLSMGLEEQTNG